MACRLARRAARVTSIGTGDVANSSSGSGCVGSAVFGGGALRGGFDSSILGIFLGDGEEPRKRGDISPSSLSESGVLRRRDEPSDGSRGDSGV